MTKEELKELFSAWLDGKTIQIYQTYKEKWVSQKNPSWDKEFKYRVKPTKIEFEDCSFDEVEYFTQIDATLFEVDSTKYQMSNRKCFIKDIETAEAYVVLPQLIRLRDEYNEGWKPDWEDKNAKHYIRGKGTGLDLGYTYGYSYILCFKSFEIRDRFFEDYKNLIEIAKPFL